MGWIRGFKVVRQRGDALVSCTCGRPNSASSMAAGEMVYRIGEITTPKPTFGPLAVFSTYEAAYRFCCDNTIWALPLFVCSCLYKPSQQKALYVVANERVYDNTYFGIWLPRRTRLATQVKLIRKIEYTPSIRFLSNTELASKGYFKMEAKNESA